MNMQIEWGLEPIGGDRKNSLYRIVQNNILKRSIPVHILYLLATHTSLYTISLNDPFQFVQIS